MEKEERKNWSEINEDATKVSKKIKDKLTEENLIEDLKESLNETLENTSKILKNLIHNVDSTINDEEIRSETKAVISNINDELQNTIKDGTNKFSSLFSKEEE
tara:strand:- start:83 stop:391 length:309 start_codon:yes stop_codon:yes gene_type:complete